MISAILHSEFILPGLLLLFTTGIVAFIAIVQYLIKLRESRKTRKRSRP